MNVLIAFASRHGSTREMANEIAEELRASGVDAELRAAGDVTSITGYDAVIIGSAIYMGRWMSDARHFVDRFQSQLVTVPVWLFSSGPLGAEHPQPAGDPSSLPEMIERTHAREHRMFSGKLDRNQLGLRERAITRMVKAPEGDFRDWDAIHSWARDIAMSLHMPYGNVDATLTATTDHR